MSIWLNGQTKTDRSSTRFRRHPVFYRKKPVVFREDFAFSSSHPQDILYIECYTLSGERELLVGRCSITLGHLPLNKPVEKWYQLKSQKGSNEGIVLLKLHYDLSFESRTNAIAALTSSPSASATQQEKEEAELKSQALPPLRFIDYFLVLGAKHPRCCHLNQTEILERYPAQDIHAKLPLDMNTPMFCFPNGYHLAHSDQAPSVFSFRMAGMVHRTVKPSDHRMRVHFYPCTMRICIVYGLGFLCARIA